MEYLLSAAYRDGLAKYTKQDFESAGFGSFTPGRLLEIADHEDSHVEILKTAVSEAGGYPVPKCEYQFLYDGPSSFIKTVFELEETMTSWYCASQAFIKRKEYSSVAAAILPTEARHSAWLNSAVRKQNPWSTSLETPLTEKTCLFRCLWIHIQLFRFISNST
ncbi:ferritin-like domain-containing protein [Amanita rubescens]|nr:ferritin-like domain-containing protein [Amanita rubescens]